MLNVAINLNADWLRAKFRTGLERRLREISANLELLAPAPEGTLLRETERLFHSLAGLGGTYGFPEITRIARLAERLCAREMTGQRLARVRMLVVALTRAGGLDSNAA